MDSTLFAGNEVTLLNFWFNGCSTCVNERPAKASRPFRRPRRSRQSRGATYRNLFITGGEAQDYVNNIFAFPATILVDKNGNIIGEPITSSIEDEQKMDAILKLVEDIKTARKPQRPFPRKIPQMIRSQH